MTSFITRTAAVGLATLIATQAHATLVSITDCAGEAESCEIIVPASGSTITKNPNNRRIYAWNELQNFTLSEDLFVNRVFDETASFVEKINNNNFKILAGTVVSSHYVQWDNAGGTLQRATATINADSQIFAFITDDQYLFDSDFLGLPTLNYNDFTNRSLEADDYTTFNDQSVDISWNAGTPGDWSRMITAYSPMGAVPLPAALPMLLAGMGLLGFAGRRRRRA